MVQDVILDEASGAALKERDPFPSATDDFPRRRVPCSGRTIATLSPQPILGVFLAQFGSGKA